jgi:hypothetical protein
VVEGLENGEGGPQSRDSVGRGRPLAPSSVPNQAQRKTKRTAIKLREFSRGSRRQKKHVLSCQQLKGMMHVQNESKHG